MASDAPSFVTGGVVASSVEVAGALVSVGASVDVDAEEVSEDVAGSEVVDTDELSAGTSDADVEAPSTSGSGVELVDCEDVDVSDAASDITAGADVSSAAAAVSE